MTDYNDGNWHGWNGGECPVLTETVVDVKFDTGVECEGHEADDWSWGEGCGIIAFRVTKPYVEPKNPREWCINPQGKSIWYDARDGLIHVREVRDDD